MSGKALTSSGIGWCNNRLIILESRVGKLFIPKSKLKQLRHKIKVKVKRNADRQISHRSDRQPQPHHHWLAELLPLCRKSMAGVRQAGLVVGPARCALGPSKARGARWKATCSASIVGNRPGERKRWSDGTKKLRFFSEGGTSHFPDRGTRIPNGWNAEPEESFLPGADRFWDATNTLAKLMRGHPWQATHGEPDAGKLARPVRRGGCRNLSRKRDKALHPYSTYSRRSRMVTAGRLKPQPGGAARVSDRNPSGRRRLPGGGRREPAPRPRTSGGVRARPERREGDAQYSQRRICPEFRLLQRGGSPVSRVSAGLDGVDGHRHDAPDAGRPQDKRISR